MDTRRGTTYIDTLIAIIITITFIPIMFNCLKISSNFLYKNLQNEIGLMQVRNILALSKEISCDMNTLYFTYANNNYEIYQSNDKLMMTPGTQFILCDVTNISFIKEGKVTFICYEEDGQMQKRALMVA